MPEQRQLNPPLCVIPASPVPMIKWRKVDGSLSPQWATAEPTLQIPSVSFEDEGTYECEAENSKGRDTVQGRIIVQGTGRDPGPASLLGSPQSRRTLLPPGIPPPPGYEIKAAAAVASSEPGVQKAHRRLQGDFSHSSSLWDNQTATFLFPGRFFPFVFSIPGCRRGPLLSGTTTAAL